MMNQKRVLTDSVSCPTNNWSQTKMNPGGPSNRRKTTFSDMKLLTERRALVTND